MSTIRLLDIQAALTALAKEYECAKEGLAAASENLEAQSTRLETALAKYYESLTGQPVRLVPRRKTHASGEL